jgi:hypothetical protein
MRIQEFPLKMYAGLFVVLLMFAVSCDGVVDNQQYDVTSKKVESGMSLLANNGGSPQLGDLLAGQHHKVGTVSVTSDDDQICVTYSLDQDAVDEGWGIYETHLAIAKALGDIPINNGGNPVPGQFPYGDDELEGVDEWSFCVIFDDLDVECDDEVYIAAHAVVKRLVAGEAIESIIYGVGTTTAASGATNDGNIYVIDPLANHDFIYFNDVWAAAGISPGPSWYPNALALDEDNGRLYFSLSQNSLYFLDLNVEPNAVVNADPDNKFNNAENVLGATFAEGYYWYILNQSDKLFRVSVDGDGLVTEVSAPIEMGSAKKLSQGDFVYKDGVIYGSSGTGAGGGDNLKGFFTYDIGNDVFTVLVEDDDYRALQLAWGLDGVGNKVLFGHQTQDGNWYTVDPATGIQTPVMEGVEVFTTDRLEDLASGFIYDEVWESETAWGFGDRFTPRGNWATYFKVTLCEVDEE